MNISNDPILEMEKATRQMNTFMDRRGKTVFQRYPLTFSLLGTFGVVAMVHGFEGMINEIPYIHERPEFMFLIGIVVLIFTGSLYKKIDSKVLD